MSISNSYPTQNPVLNLNFATGSDQFLDSRISFSRADSTPSNVHYRSNEKHLSSENLLLQSQDFDTTWANDGSVGLAGVTGSQTAPDGTSTAWLITADTFTGQASRLQQSISISTNTEYTMVAHVKAGTASHAWMSFRGASTQSCSVTLNFSTQALTNTAFNFANVSSSVIALGNSWFKLTLTGTTDNSTASPLARIGISDGSAVAANGNADWDASGETIYAWGVQLSSVNSLVYDSPTTTQISRKYSSTLKSVTNAGDPRFEYSPADGQSVGLLIEAQSSNLLTYSEDWTNSDFTKFVAITSNAAIAPTGELAADLVAATSSLGDHITRQSLTVVSGKTYTLSVFAKASGCNFVRVGGASTAAMPAQASFDLVNGTIGTVDYGTAKIEDVGNGFYRCSVTGTAASNTSTHVEIRLMQSDNTPSWTGDDYSGLLLFGQMAEQSSSVSSYIKSTSSSVSRASDSCSVATADFGFTGGPVSVYTDADAGAGSYPCIFALTKGGTNPNSIRLFRSTSTSSKETDFRYNVKVNSANVVSKTPTGSGTVSKFAVRADTDNSAVKPSGITLESDTTCPIPILDTLEIGFSAGVGHLNGTIRNLMLWNVALSDTELGALVD
jgi:hypothetical protein